MYLDYNELKTYRRDALLGALGAFLMLAGDLCLSAVPACQNDSSLFVREAYLNGSLEEWRFPLLIAAGFCGMVLEFFAMRMFYHQILPQYRKTRAAVLIGGVIILATAAALHLFIGSLADWTSTLSPLIGREETTALIQAQFVRLMPSMYLTYAGLALLFLTSAYAVLTGKTVLPRWMSALHMIVFQLLFVLIPDIREASGATISTWDYVLSQCSTNGATCIWLIANAIWAEREIRMSRL